MFRIVLRIVAIAALALLPVSVRAQSVDDVIASNIKARGGLEKIKAVRSVRTRAWHKCKRMTAKSDGRFRPSPAARTRSGCRRTTLKLC